MSELNRDQIIKALECCSSSDGVYACDSGCPYWGEDYDTCPCIEDPNFILKNALSLIKELTEERKDFEIRALRAEFEASKYKDRYESEKQSLFMLSESYDHLEKTKDELLSERARLTEENERLHASCTELERKCASLCEENERLTSLCTSKDVIIEDLNAENERLRAIPEQLHKEMSERMLEERKIERKLAVRKMQEIITDNYAVSKVHYVEDAEPTITYQLTNWQLANIVKAITGGGNV